MVLLVQPDVVQACTCTKLQGKYTKLMTKHDAAVAAGDAVKVGNLRGRIVNFVKNNWKEIPDCPPPVLPPAWCPDPAGGGGGDAFAFPGGRGHGLGGIDLPGDTAITGIFLRNADPSTGKTVTVRVFPDSLNPPGFVLLDSVFTVFLPPLPDTPGIVVEVPIEIVPLSLVGTQALFHATVEEADGRFWNEPIQTPLTVSDVEIVQLDPIEEVPVSGGFTVGWRIFNHAPSPVTKTFNTLLLPDAEAFVTLNNGSPYPIFNSYLLDKNATGGSVVVPAASGPGSPGFVDVLCDMVSNELCEPTMLGCKGIEIDGGLSIVATPNDADGPFDPPISSQGRDLVGSPAGGFVEVLIFSGPVTIPIGVPTFPGQPVEEIIDQLVFQVHDMYLFANDFAFQAAAIDNFMDVFGPPGSIIQYNSFDPGLNWQVPGCEAPGWMHPQILPGDIALLQWIEGGNPPAEYQVQVTPLAGGPPFVANVPGGTDQLQTPPLDVGAYTFQIRSICDPFVPIASPFSYPDTFRVEPCNNGNPPSNPASTVGPGNVALSWDPVQGTTACQVEGTRTSPPGPTGKRNIIGLEPDGATVNNAFLGAGSTWQWRVRCACNTNPVNATPWSAVDAFSVPILREGLLTSTMEVAPNPADQRLRLRLEAREAGPLTWRMVDALGRTVLTQKQGLTAGPNVWEVDVSDVPVGLYLIQAAGTEPVRVEIQR